MSRMTVAAVLKKVLTPIGQTIQPLRERPILELDELWSFVASKENTVWIWVALERQTRRIVGLAFGDRSSNTLSQFIMRTPRGMVNWNDPCAISHVGTAGTPSKPG